MRRLALPITAAFLGGCTQGTLSWSGGSDAIRTALFRDHVDSDARRVTVVLSNGTFGCDLPDQEDPEAQSRALQDLITAACRENARHVVLHAFRTPDLGRGGTYPGESWVRAADVDSARPRAARAAYYGVDEAFLVDTVELGRTYAAAEEDYWPDLGDGGEVRLEARGDALGGSFWFPGPDLAGQFTAAECPEDAAVFELLDPPPAHLCP